MSTKYGRIVFTLIRSTARIVALLLLAMTTTFGWQISSIKQAVTQPSPALVKRLQNTVNILSEKIGTRNYSSYEALNKAADFIESSFKEFGYSVEEWTYEINGKEFKNIIARNDQRASDEYIVIGAHYDSCFNPGADDNASGIAGMLELARMLKTATTRNNIMFVAFVNEEPPFFKTDNMGSRVFIKMAQQKNIKIRSAVILEMIGFYTDAWSSQKYLPLLGPFYPNKGDFIALIGNFSSKNMVDAIKRTFDQQHPLKMVSLLSPDFIPGINFSDHASFWEVNIPAVMITDTAYLRNKNYHLFTDTVDTLNFEKMARLVEGLKSSIVNLAGQ